MSVAAHERATIEFADQTANLRRLFARQEVFDRQLSGFPLNFRHSILHLLSAIQSAALCNFGSQPSVIPCVFTTVSPHSAIEFQVRVRPETIQFAEIDLGIERL